MQPLPTEEAPRPRPMGPLRFLGPGGWVTRRNPTAPAGLSAQAPGSARLLTVVMRTLQAMERPGIGRLRPAAEQRADPNGKDFPSHRPAWEPEAFCRGLDPSLPSGLLGDPAQLRMGQRREGTPLWGVSAKGKKPSQPRRKTNW